MTLFDVIRYPISDPPTLEQLQALPDEIYNKWAIEVFSFPPDAIIKREVMSYALSAMQNPGAASSVICELREIIKHYDNL